jgi:hypothetical protein
VQSCQSTHQLLTFENYLLCCKNYSGPHLFFLLFHLWCSNFSQLCPLQIPSSFFFREAFFAHLPFLLFLDPSTCKMADQADKKKVDKGKQPATMPPAETDVTETNVTEADVTEADVTEADVTEADAENLAVDHQDQQNPDQETAAGEVSVTETAAGEPTEEAASSSEGATTAQEASAGQQAQLLKPWEQRALRNGRTPLPDSRPPIAGESSASGSQAQVSRAEP